MYKVIFLYMYIFMNDHHLYRVALCQFVFVHGNYACAPAAVLANIQMLHRSTLFAQAVPLIALPS